MSTWVEVRVAASEKRCELILSGPDISKRIEEDGLDTTIFKISHLNFLEISKTCMAELPADIGLLTNLTRLILCNNELQSLPTSLGSLKKLKFLNVSSNSIAVLPPEVGNLTELQSLNLSYNKLTALPVLTKLVNLVSVNISHNGFTELPVNVFDQNLLHFTDLVASNNKITVVPPSINTLSALKVLDLSDNEISVVPGELGDCTKLNKLNLKGNKLKDKRLLKLVDQCHVKQVMEYIRSHCPKSGGGGEEGKQAKSKKKAKQSKKAVESDEIVKLLDQIEVLHVKDDTLKVISTPNVQDVRPYIVCCIIHNICLDKDSKFKKFISLQTKLHDTVCEKRNAATIATHDLAKITGNVTYDAKAPNEIKIIPLGRKKEMSAAELYAQLNEEADALRKEKKKNAYSGIHKYLYLLKDKSLYPCLMDSTTQVISFPPITNSDGTKISEDTKSILVEVSGNALPVCKKVMDALLQETLKLGIGEHGPPVNGEEDSQSPENHLNIEQVQVVDEEGHLKVVYPSRTDIQIDGVNVIRLQA